MKDIEQHLQHFVYSYLYFHQKPRFQGIMGHLIIGSSFSSLSGISADHQTLQPYEVPKYKMYVQSPWSSWIDGGFDWHNFKWRLYKTTSVWISIGPTVLRKAKNMTDKICKNLSWVLSKWAEKPLSKVICMFKEEIKHTEKIAKCQQ